MVLGDWPVDWDTVVRINTLGSVVKSRSVTLDPPPEAAPPAATRAVNTTTLGVVGAAAAIGLVEVVLLIGPAFAVGQQRSRRESALLAASGGDPRDVRRVLLVNGFVVGLGAASAGAVLGIGAAAVVRCFVVRSDPFGLPDLRVPWGALALLVGAGTAIGVTAALVPARRAARMDVVAALGVRRTEARSRRAVPIAGVVLAAAGFAASLAGATTRRPVLLVGGVVVLELGIVLAAGGIVSLVGLLAPYLRPAGRYAVRDAARHCVRTAPALAAIIAAMAGAAAGVVYLSSAQARIDANHEPVGTPGTVTVSVTGAPGSSEPRAADVTTAEGVLRARCRSPRWRP